MREAMECIDWSRSLPANNLNCPMTTMPSFLPLSLAALAAANMLVSPAFSQPTDNDSRARQFIARHEATVRPLEVESNRC